MKNSRHPAATLYWHRDGHSAKWNKIPRRFERESENFFSYGGVPFWNGSSKLNLAISFETLNLFSLAHTHILREALTEARYHSRAAKKRETSEVWRKTFVHGALFFGKSNRYTHFPPENLIGPIKRLPWEGVWHTWHRLTDWVEAGIACHVNEMFA